MFHVRSELEVQLPLTMFMWRHHLFILFVLNPILLTFRFPQCVSNLFWAGNCYTRVKLRVNEIRSLYCQYLLAASINRTMTCQELKLKVYLRIIHFCGFFHRQRVGRFIIPLDNCDSKLGECAIPASSESSGGF